MNDNTKKELLIVAQGFYGNRTATEINYEDIDKFILGHIDGEIGATEQVDRTIVNIPNTDNLVIVYNKYQENNELRRKEELFSKEGYEFKPLVVIPEIDLKLYSRCIVCRINNGDLEGLQNGDFDKFINYLSE